MKYNIYQYKLDIENLRREINDIDTNIIDLISKRMSIIKKIGEIKNNYQLNIIDLDRESILQKLHHQLAIKYNLNPIFINNLFDTIIKYAREIQKDQ